MNNVWNLKLSLSLFAWCCAIASSAAQNAATLHTFQGFKADGAIGSLAADGYGGLIADPAGNVYGTTPFGGTGNFCVEENKPVGCGTVFQEIPPAVKGGAWTEKILYSFDPNYVGDGTQPTGGLVMDAEGNLYGTTVQGQGANEPGNIFELSPPTKVGGHWKETNLYTFSGAGNGYHPNGSLIADAAGNLDGTTSEGGQYNVGTVYEVSPPAQSGGSWTESVLFSFGSNREDGSFPLAGLIMDSKGNFYGTTSAGGASSGAGSGTVFQLLKPSIAGGAWTERVVYRFSGSTDGGDPVASLLLYKGALYGTTRGGGNFGGGTVFQITNPAGRAVETVLYSFVRYGVEGFDPRTALVVDAAGNLYGTTDVGGPAEAGTVFKLAPPTSGGAWTYSVLYKFTGEADGGNPVTPLLLINHALYGLASGGGDGHCFANLSYGCGTVFEVAP
jgi:uncharacterized repeat protein (TIGR03803 family)